nr:hypothetical protein [Cellulomonas sp. APG4]
MRQREGSAAVALAVARCRPQVVCAYPISPQTHIVEEVSRLVAAGELTCEFLTMDSETSAMSGVIGASAVGVRSWTATASQGLLHMSEAVHNAAGLGLPIVMTVANRAIGAPINIWNDHSDSMSQRDAGWVHLHAASNQEAVDLHLQAFRLAESLSVPVMVCMDGFVLTHATEPVDVPEQGVVDAFLPPFVPRQRLDPEAPVSIGAMVGPEAFTEVRYLGDRQLRRALEEVPRVADELARHLGRHSAGLVQPYRTDDADVVLVGLGSVMGTVRDVVDTERDAGRRAGALTVTTYRPFPAAAVAGAVPPGARVLVIERSLAPGSSGPVTADVREALVGRDAALHTVVAGLGGRPVTSRALAELLARERSGLLDGTTFLDLRSDVVAHEVGRPA